MTTKRFLSTNLLLMSLPLTLICSPATYADERSSDFHAETSPGDSTITLYGDQYERLDPAAGAGPGPGSSGGSGSGSSGGSSGVVVSFSVSKPGRVPLVCVAYAPDPNHLFCRPYEPEEPEEPAPAVVPVVVSARDVASLMVDGSGITRQPPGATARVDMDLIAYTDPSTRSLSTTVAGTLVEVEATPTSYHWDWGDATTTTTTSPGAPWPHQTVTHRYHHSQTGVHLTLTTTWTARYRPQDGTWHDVQGTVTTTQQSDTFNLVDTTTHLTDHAEHKQGH